MKKLKKVSCFVTIIVTATTTGYIGFVTGNSVAAKRSATSALFQQVSVFEQISKGHHENAKQLSEIFISANYDFLNSDLFWYEALKEFRTVDTSSIYARIESKASSISKRRSDNALSGNEVEDELRKTLKNPSIKIESN